VVSEFHQVEDRRCQIAQLSILEFPFIGVINENARHQIGGVRSIGRAILIHHEFCISVVGNDDYSISVFPCCLRYRLIAASTVSTALTAAENTPVWPTMSGFAKFRQTKSTSSYPVQE